MKNPKPQFSHPLSRASARLGLAVGLLSLAVSSPAVEDPPGCSFPSGRGADYQSGFHIVNTQAHLGDRVPLTPTFGMVAGACRARHVNGTAYIATGILTNYLIDATFDPGVPVTAPRPPFQPGPYELLLTPELVGADVSTPRRSVPGLPNVVRVLADVIGEAQTSDAAQFGSFHTVNIHIVQPDLQVVQQPAYPTGQTCFRADQLIECTGYVTNCGDIPLTSLALQDSGVGAVTLFNPATGQALPANAVLLPGACAMFTNRFAPTAQDIAAGRATNLLTATARDTTTIGGPRALVANAAASSCAICTEPPPNPLAATLTDATYTANHEFRCTVTGAPGVSYVVQATTELNAKGWQSLGTNTSPFIFVDSAAGMHPLRLYRALAVVTP